MRLVRDTLIVIVAVLLFFSILGVGFSLYVKLSVKTSQPDTDADRKFQVIAATNTRVRQLYEATLTATAATAQANRN